MWKRSSCCITWRSSSNLRSVPPASAWRAKISSASAGVVGQQETDARVAQHRVVDRFELVGQRIDLGDGDGEVGVVFVGQADALGVDGQAEVCRVAGKGGLSVVGSELDLALELGQVEDVLEELACLCPDGLDLDALVLHPRRQHADRLRPEGAGEEGAGGGGVVHGVGPIRPETKKPQPARITPVRNCGSYVAVSP